MSVTDYQSNVMQSAADSPLLTVDKRIYNTGSNVHTNEFYVITVTGFY